MSASPILSASAMQIPSRPGPDPDQGPVQPFPPRPDEPMPPPDQPGSPPPLVPEQQPPRYA